MPHLSLVRRATPTATPQVAPAEPAPSVCANCGATVTRHFCGECGERRLDERDLSVRHFLHEAAEAFTDVDSALLRSFRALLTQPGLLTAEWVQGRRSGYLKPLRVFLLCNVVFFIAFSHWQFGVLSIPFQTLYGWMSDGSLQYELVHRTMAAKHLTLAEYARRYDAASDNLARTLVLLLVPLLVPVLALLNRKRGRYLVEHVVFSTHLWAFLLLLVPATFAWVVLSNQIGVLTGHPVPQRFLGDAAFSAVIFCVTATYLTVALRRVYSQGWIGAVVRALALCWTLLPVLEVYRRILFVVTWYWVS